MKNFIVVLYEGNTIKQILAQFRSIWEAKNYIEENHIEFTPDICQYSKFQSPLFIKIEKP